MPIIASTLPISAPAASRPNNLILKVVNCVPEPLNPIPNIIKNRKILIKSMAKIRANIARPAEINPICYTLSCPAASPASPMTIRPIPLPRAKATTTAAETP